MFGRMIANRQLCARGVLLAVTLATPTIIATNDFNLREKYNTDKEDAKV